MKIATIHYRSFDYSASKIRFEILVSSFIVFIFCHRRCHRPDRPHRHSRAQKRGKTQKKRKGKERERIQRIKNEEKLGGNERPWVTLRCHPISHDRPAPCGCNSVTDDATRRLHLRLPHLKFHSNIPLKTQKKGTKQNIFKTRPPLPRNSGAVMVGRGGWCSFSHD